MKHHETTAEIKTRKKEKRRKRRENKEKRREEKKKHREKEDFPLSIDVFDHCDVFLSLMFLYFMLYYIYMGFIFGWFFIFEGCFYL